MAAQPARGKISACHQSGIEMSLDVEEREEFTKVGPLPRVTLQGAGLLTLAVATSMADEVGSGDLSHGGGEKQKW